MPVESTPIAEIVPETEEEDLLGTVSGYDPGYDPGEYTVDEVLEHLRSNPDQLSTVVELERTGRGRKGILELA